MDTPFSNIVAVLQNTVTEILSRDSILSSMGAEFASENSLDIEFQVGKALKQQGLACMVMTPKMTYQGHNGAEQVWTVDDLRVQCLENPIVNRARLKKEGKTAGTALDVAVQVQRRLAGPQGGNYGRFTSKGIEQKEMDGLLAAEAIFQCTVYSDQPPTSCDISGNWCEIPYIRISDLSDFIDDYLSTHMPAVDGFLPLSGGQMTGAISAYSNTTTIDWGYDGSLAAGTPGIEIRTAGEDGYYIFPAQDGSREPADYDVLRRKDLSSTGLEAYEIDQYDTVIRRYGGTTEHVKLSGEVSLEDIESLGNLSDIVAIEFGTGVTALGDHSCSGLTYLKSVHCARTLRRIGEGAFYHIPTIQLTSFVVDPQRDNFFQESQNVQTAYKILEIETSAFANCYYLTYAQFPNLLQTYIGVDAFNGAFQSTTFSPSYAYRGIFFYGTPPAAFNSDAYINAYNLSAVSSFVRGFNPTSKEWVLEQHYSPDFQYTTLEFELPALNIAYYTLENKAFYYNPLSVIPPPTRARTQRVYIPELTVDHTAREIYALLSVQSDFTARTLTKFTTGAQVDKYLNGDLSTFTSEFLKPGTKHFWHFFEYEPNKFYVEEMDTPPSYLSDYVKATNTTPLTITVPYDNGFTLQTPNGTPLLKTIDLNRTAIESLSAGNVEVGTNGSVVRYTGDGETPLSAWNWLKTNSRGLGDLISSEHNSILGEVGEDFVSFNWLIQQGYVTSGEISAELGQYLPLSGGQMEGSIGWDYGGSGGPRIDGPWSPQQLAFSTTFSDDQGKQAFLDFGRISANGQYTIAYVEDIQAALGDLSALIHAT